MATKTPHGATGLDRFLSAPPALLLFVLPFAHVTALRSIAFVLTIAAAIYVWRKYPGPPVPLKLPLALWAGMALLSLAWARDPAYSLGEVRAEIAYDIVYYLAFFALTRDAWSWNTFRVALLAGVAAMTGIAIWVYRRYAGGEGLNADSYLGGVLSISTYLVTVFPLILVAAFEFRGNRRALAITLLAAIVVLLVGYFTFNRMFILAVLVSSLAVLALFIGRLVPRQRRLATSLAAVAVLIGVSGIFFVSVAQRRAQEVGTTAQTMIERDLRRDAWSFSVGFIRAHPFSGVGFGLFAAEDLYRERFPKPEEGAYTHAHNPFLNYGVQMGVGGITVLVFLLACLCREFWKLLRSPSARVEFIGVSGLAMVLGVALKAQPEDLWGRHNGYLFWALTGMMLGYAHRMLREQGRASGSGSP